MIVHEPSAQQSVPCPTRVPARCQARVAGVQRRWVWFNRALGLCQLTATACLSLLIAVALDVWLRGPMIERTLLLLLTVAAVGWVLARRVWPRWASLSRDRAALLLEQIYPTLAGRLITAVQLADSIGRDPARGSVELYGLVRDTAERQAEAIDVAQVVPAKAYQRPLLMCLALIILSAVPTVLFPQAASLGLRRILLPWQELNWPLQTQIELLAVPTPVRIVRGGTLLLKGRVTGAVPASGTLHVRTAAGAADRARFEIAGDGTFTVRFRPVNNHLLAAVEAGDAMSPWISVEMVPPPEITAIDAELIYPPYTRLPPQRRADGNIQAVFGSDVRLQVTASKPVRSATLTWEGGEAQAMVCTATDTAQVQFRVTATTAYRVHLADELGFHNEDPVLYQIEMTENEYPRVEHVKPHTDRRVAPRAVLPITVTASDDFGVTAALLCYRRGKAEDVTEVPIPLQVSGRRIEIPYAWSLESLGLVAGDTLTWWIEIRDEGEHATQKDWPTSPARRLEILDEPSLTRWLGEQVEQIMAQLADTESLQGECTDSVTRVAQALEQGYHQGAEERTRAEKWRQDRLARSLAKLAERLGQIAEDYAISNVGQPVRVERLVQTSRALATLAGADMPAVVLALEDALAALRE